MFKFGRGSFVCCLKVCKCVFLRLNFIFVFVKICYVFDCV